MMVDNQMLILLGVAAFAGFVAGYGVQRFVYVFPVMQELDDEDDGVREELEVNPHTTKAETLETVVDALADRHPHDAT